MCVPTGVWMAMTHLIAVVASVLLVLGFTAVLPVGLGLVVLLGMIVAVGLVATGVGEASGGTPGLPGPSAHRRRPAGPLLRPRPRSALGTGVPERREHCRPGRDDGPVHDRVGSVDRRPEKRPDEHPGRHCVGSACAFPPPGGSSSTWRGRTRGGRDASVEGRPGSARGRARGCGGTAGLSSLAVARRGGRGVSGPVGGRGPYMAWVAWCGGDRVELPGAGCRPSGRVASHGGW